MPAPSRDARLPEKVQFVTERVPILLMPPLVFPCWIVRLLIDAVMPVNTSKTPTPPLGVPPGSQPVQPPSTTIVAPVPSIVVVVWITSVPCVSVIGPAPVLEQFSPAWKVTVPPPAIAERNVPALPSSAQLVTVPAA